MKVLNPLFIDIETVSGAASLHVLSERLKAQWMRKAQHLKHEEESSADEFYFNHAAIYAEFGKVVCISLGILYQDDHEQLNLRIKGISGDHEKELLQQFQSTIGEKMNAQTLQFCGHNIKEFDLPYLCRRMLVHGLALPACLQLAGKKPWEVKHLDTMDMWKFGDHKHFTPLALLTEIFGIPSPKDDISGADVNRVYYLENGLDSITKYCNRDVLATAQVYLRMQGKDLIDESRVHYADTNHDQA